MYHTHLLQKREAWAIWAKWIRIRQIIGEMETSCKPWFTHSSSLQSCFGAIYNESKVISLCSSLFMASMYNMRHSNIVISSVEKIITALRVPETEKAKVPRRNTSFSIIVSVIRLLLKRLNELKRNQDIQIIHSPKLQPGLLVFSVQMKSGFPTK